METVAVNLDRTEATPESSGLAHAWTARERVIARFGAARDVAKVVSGRASSDVTPLVDLPALPDELPESDDYGRGLLRPERGMERRGASRRR
jgi:hypothetical protein